MRSLRDSARRLRDAAIAFAGPSALVLTYHRVADLRSDPQMLAVAPDRFADQLEALAESYRVVPLSLLVEELRAGHVVDLTLAVTFDDGYADNLTVAAPALVGAALPATVFVSSAYVDSDREFWWDEVERVSFAGDAPKGWTVHHPAETEQQRSYLDLMSRARDLTAGSRDALIEAVRERTGLAPGARESHRTLTRGELTTLAEMPGIDIGGHTERHDVLSQLSPDEQRDTIERDRETLTKLTGTEVGLFSYPYGQRSDFTDTTVSLVEGAGYVGAAANYPGLIKRGTSPLRLPRFVVRDWTGDELVERVDGWFGVRRSNRKPR